MNADPEALEAPLHRYAKPRLPVPVAQTQRQALAADGKRIRGANRNGTVRYETATLVEHSSGVPLASLNFHDRNGELAAVGALLEVTPIAGALITLDALHTTREVAASIVAQHRADYLLTVKRNCPETCQALATMPWEQARSLSDSGRKQPYAGKSQPIGETRTRYSRKFRVNRAKGDVCCPHLTAKRDQSDRLLAGASASNHRRAMGASTVATSKY